MSEVTEKDKDLKTPRKKWILIGVVAFLFITTIGLGPLSFNLYQSEVNKDEVAYSLNNLSLDCKTQTYKIQYFLNDKPYDSHVYVGSQSSGSEAVQSTPLEVYTEVVDYKGNYFLPFYKDYSVKYKANLNEETFSENPVVSNQYAAKVEGTIKIRIYGLCTIPKAKEVAKKTIMDSVAFYINNQMSNAMSQ